MKKFVRFRKLEGSSMKINNVQAGSIYERRKKMEPQFKELFKILLTMGDKNMQDRVIRAINDECDDTPKMNGMNTCPKCSHKFLNLRRNAADATTQTTTEETTNKVATSKDSAQPPRRASLTLEEIAEQEEAAAFPPRRKRRKRKISLPQANHVSQAQVQRRLRPKVAVRPKEVDELETNESGKRKRLRSDSLGSIGDVDTLVNELLMPKNTFSDINLTMAKDFCESEHISAISGLLPIHEAITENQANRLRRQIFVWNQKQVDLNDLITEDNQDCLQLAIMYNVLPTIVDILLKSNLNVNCLDEHSNTIIHLAILNEVELSSLEMLAHRIEFSSLLRLNDKGHSVLHTAVRHDRFLYAETLLNVIDKRTLGAQIYVRPSKTDERLEFLKFYETVCNSIEPKKHNSSTAVVKRELLNLGERCSGNTAVYSAIEDRTDHLIYFLLAHLSDPRCENHNGQDAKSYFGEFGKSLGLSLKIDRAMEKIIAILDDSAK